MLGTRFCDPDQLITTKQRNKLAAANKALCYLSRAEGGSFKEVSGPAYTGFSDMRLFKLEEAANMRNG